MRTRIPTVLALTVGALLLTAVPARAEDQPAQAAEPVVCPICSKANVQDGNYSATSGTTFVRGASNTLLGWTELIRRPAEEAKAGGNVVVGVGKGVGEGVMRTLSGVGEVLTFWVPKTKANKVNIAKDCPLCMGRKTAQSALPERAAAN